jgi:hypothetical protein
MTNCEDCIHFNWRWARVGTRDIRQELGWCDLSIPEWLIKVVGVTNNSERNTHPKSCCSFGEQE